MANDVTIEVEARVGDAIAQMTLTAAAVRALGDAGESTGSRLGDDSNNRSMSSRLGSLRRALSNMGDRGPLGMVVRGFGNLASAMLAPIDLGFKFAQNFERMGSLAQGFIGIGSSLAVGMVGLAAAIAAVTFAATALASILGTLVAIVADLVAPVTLLGGLLGGLAAGFVIGAKRAAEGGGKLNEFSSIVDKLGSMFSKTSSILAHVFLPYFVELGHAAERALMFLDKVIKLPLGQAFRMIDTQGTQLLGKFVDRVAEVLSKPIRLAFHVAFEDTAFSNMVSDWWHRFTGFLFGTTERHPVELRPGVFKIKQTTVDGVFQPFIEWFNRHHFTRQGIGIGRQILSGVLNSGMRARIEDFIVQIFKDAARQAGRAFIASLSSGALGPVLFALVKRAGSGIVNLFLQADQRISQGIRSALGRAWDWVLGKVRSIWSTIVAFVTHPISINIDWPSPPSWFGKLGGGLSDLGGGIVSGAGGLIPDVARAGASVAQPRVAMAAPSVVVHIHGADLSDAATQRRVAQTVGKHIVADWRRRAGGH